MGLKEIMNREKVVRREVPGIGVIYVRRLATREVLGMPDGQFGKQLVAAAILDENQKPVFAAVAEVDAMDWGLFSILQTEALRVNGIEVPKEGGGEGRTADDKNKAPSGAESSG